MRYFIIAGEQSGDLHGSNLVRELRGADEQAEIWCWGGDLMESAGAKLIRHYKETAFMGFVVIAKNLRKIAANLDLCKKHILEFKPDAVILIDYPGFNLRIAEFAKKNKLKVFYYISPKFWAWNEKRVDKVKKYVDRMFIIFPFETDFYRKHGISVEYMGNPLVDEIQGRISSMPGRDEIKRSTGVGFKPVIALLAGSRIHEVKSILPQMLKVIDHFPDYQFVLAGVKNLPDELYRNIIGKKPVIFVKEKTYEILNISEAALVASGTATLEAALFNVPQVVCYKGDFFSMLIAWMVIKVKYIALVNLIMDSEVVRELIGYSLNGQNLVRELRNILPGSARRESIMLAYKDLKEKLGAAGASCRIAREMTDILRSRVGERENS